MQKDTNANITNPTLDTAHMKLQTPSQKKTEDREQDHANFLSSLRDRLKVDEQTIDNLEKRMGGKCPNP